MLATTTAIACGEAHAMTLQQVLAASYTDNPALNGQRASLRQLDEAAAVARAEGRPTLSGSASYTQGVNGLRVLDGYNRAIVAGATATVPLYQGGRVRNEIKAADTRDIGGRSDLRAAEGDTFVTAVTAYMDVLRDRAILAFDQQNVRVLQDDVTGSNKRFRGGDLTKTDVAQSQARLDGARSRVESAQAQLIGSEENFRRVSGLAPAVLDEPPPLPPLPLDVGEAEQIALENSPTFASSKEAVKAAHFDVGVARGARLPTLSATGSENYYSYRDRFGGIGDESGNAVQAGVTVTVPIYQGGIVSARVRQARDAESQALEQGVGVERDVVSNVESAFANYIAASNTIKTSQEAVQSNTLALRGVRIENAAGLRQVLDVLNAELELLDSKIALVSAKHDAYVAGFQLLNVMGLATSSRLNLNSIAIYDPVRNYQHAIRVVGDEADGPKPNAVSKPIYGPVPHVDQPVDVGPD